MREYDTITFIILHSWSLVVVVVAVACINFANRVSINLISIVKRTAMSRGRWAGGRVQLTDTFGQHVVCVMLEYFIAVTHK